MKKTVMLLATAVTIAFYACGPSAEEQAKRAQEIKDSIAKVQADSAAAAEAAAKAAAEAAAAEAAAAAEKAKQDSIAAAEEAAKKGSAKKAPAKPKVEGLDNTKPAGRTGATKQ